MSRRHQVVSKNAPATQPFEVAASQSSRNGSPASGPLARGSPDLAHRGTALPLDLSQNRSGSASPVSTTSGGFFIPGMTSAETIYNAYLEAQRRISELEQEVRDLKAQLADAKLQSNGKGARRKGVSANSQDDVASAIVEEIKKLGRHFQLFYTPFQVDPKEISAPRPNFASDDAVRYATTKNQALGVTAELYETTPAKFHEIMALTKADGNGSNFSKTFRDAMGASRCSSLLQLRRDAAGIFGLPSTYFPDDPSSAPPRDTIPEIQSLLGSIVSPKPGTIYPKFPAILCLNGDTSKPTNRFLNVHLFIVARAMIFGKSAGRNKARAIGRSPSTYLRPDAAAETTFGLIAWVSIMIRYALSKDETFTHSGVGPQTRITYGSDFDYYKRWLIETQNDPAGTAWVEQLLVRWDEEVFSVHNKNKGNVPSAETEVIELDDAAEIARDMRMLRMAVRDDTPAPVPAPLDDGEEDNFYVEDPPTEIDPEPQPHAVAVQGIIPCPIILSQSDIPNTLEPPLNEGQVSQPTNVSNTIPISDGSVAPASTRPQPRPRSVRATRSAANTNPPPADLTPMQPESSTTTVNDRGRGLGRGRGRGGKKRG